MRCTAGLQTRATGRPLSAFSTDGECGAHALGDLADGTRSVPATLFNGDLRECDNLTATALTQLESVGWVE